MQTATIYIECDFVAVNQKMVLTKRRPPEVAKLLAACAGVTGWVVYTS